ncbi:MAG: hypothetical protein LBJ12_09710 [Oscillospiraceae bacterium]|jgi:hypothetical protein|nr:hypothetical protein [Oscillospiraceae bacterium]
MYNNCFETEEERIKRTIEENRFKTISDFKWCMRCGGEVEFCWGDRCFGVFPKMNKTPEAAQQILIVEKFVPNQDETERWYDTADEALEFNI